MDIDKVLKDKINCGTKDAAKFVNLLSDGSQKNNEESFEVMPEVLGPFQVQNGKTKVESRPEYHASLAQILKNLFTRNKPGNQTIDFSQSNTLNIV